MLAPSCFLIGFVIPNKVNNNVRQHQTTTTTILSNSVVGGTICRSIDVKCHNDFSICSSRLNPNDIVIKINVPTSQNGHNSSFMRLLH